MQLRWTKSSFSTDADDNCLELASQDQDILVRESEDPGVIARVSAQRLIGLLTCVKAGRLDHLA